MTTGTTPETAVRRTRLAWRRTVLGASVVTPLAGRIAIQHDLFGLAGGALVAVLLGLLTLAALARYRLRALASAEPEAARFEPLLAGAVLVWYVLAGSALIIQHAR